MLELPVKAATKFRNLIDAEQAAQDVVGSTTRRISDASRALGTAPESVHPQIEADLARYQDKLAAAQARHRTYANMNAQLRLFLQTLANDATLEDARTKPPKVVKGETLAATAMRIRLKISTLSSERSRVAACSVPMADLKKAAEQHVAELCKRGKPKIAFGHGRDFRVIFDATIDGQFSVRHDIGAALAWLDRKTFLQRLVEEIEALPKPALALSAKERADRLAALDAELLALEFEEEACIEASEVEGPVLQRRPDADPRAVLGVTVHQSKRAAAKPERVRSEAS
ncbi:MAG TPA: hypothetical protein VMT08_19930 [Bradyrhizobium sp.]|nr:hypothetical protein [Bradyrhizobium sp.]